MSWTNVTPFSPISFISLQFVDALLSFVSGWKLCFVFQTLMSVNNKVYAAVRSMGYWLMPQENWFSSSVQIFLYLVWSVWVKKRRARTCPFVNFREETGSLTWRDLNPPCCYKVQQKKRRCCCLIVQWCQVSWFTCELERDNLNKILNQTNELCPLWKCYCQSSNSIGIATAFDCCRDIVIKINAMEFYSNHKYFLACTGGVRIVDLCGSVESLVDYCQRSNWRHRRSHCHSHCLSCQHLYPSTFWRYCSSYLFWWYYCPSWYHYLSSWCTQSSCVWHDCWCPQCSLL